TVRSALTATESFPDADIRVIDARTIAGPLASIVLEADRVAKRGAGPDEVEAVIREMMPRARIYFLVDTLDFLRRGGRIGGAAALVGSILQIKPILTFADGQVQPFEKERTKKRALARLIKPILTFADGQVQPFEKERTKKRALARLQEIVAAEAARGADAHLTVMHAAVPDQATALAAAFKTALDLQDVLIMDLVPAIITHAGPGALAVGFFTPPTNK
ncbi:MAG: DegV family protein, partial [Anaerolineae bacterium]|nr:DegV family protein [Anaerolineae bacterium]